MCIYIYQNDFPRLSFKFIIAYHNVYIVFSQSISSNMHSPSNVMC